MKTQIDNLTRGLAAITLIAGALAVLPGCRGDRSDKPPRQFLPDMDDSPKWKPQTRSEFYEDGRSMRPQVPGTVAFGPSTDPEDPTRANVLREDVGYYTGKSADGKALAKIPASFKVDAKAIERGQQRFNIYCSVCHGYDGSGKGTVADFYAVAPANFHDPVLSEAGKDLPMDGYVFGVIRNGLWSPDGKMRMPAYGHAIKEYDAWAIVAYIRTLQAWRSGNRADVPEAELKRLDTQAAAQPVSTTPAAPTTPAPTPAKPAAPAAPATETKP